MGSSAPSDLRDDDGPEALHLRHEGLSMTCESIVLDVSMHSSAVEVTQIGSLKALSVRLRRLSQYGGRHLME